MTDVEYAQFLRGKIKAELNCPVLVFGSSDPDDVVSVFPLRFNEYSCGMLIRNDQGRAVARLEGVTDDERKAYIQGTPAEQVVLAFVNPLDAMTFLADHTMQAIALVGEHQGVQEAEDMDEMMQELGARARADLLALRRAARAYLRDPSDLKREKLEALLVSDARTANP